MVINAIGNNNSILRNNCQNYSLLQKKEISGISKNKSGKFDTLVKAINSSTTTKSNNVNINSIKMSIDTLTNDEQLYLAKKAYDGMQFTISGAIGTTEHRIESFKKIKAEKDYYESMINDKANICECIGQNYVIKEEYMMTENGKYRCANLKAGDYISIDNIKSNIAYVDNALNNIVKMTHTDNYWASTNYNTCAETFSSVFPQLSSKYSSLFDTKKCSFIKDKNLTVDNFIEKSQTNVDDLKNRSKNLTKMYEDEFLKDMFTGIDPNITIDSIQKHLKQIYEVQNQNQLFSCYA